jgi:hypothetical protein
MGEASCTYGRQERCIQEFGGGYLREKAHLKDLDVDGSIISK